MSCTQHDRLSQISKKVVLLAWLNDGLMVVMLYILFSAADISNHFTNLPTEKTCLTLSM